ncbi:MAG: N-acetylmuramoyl-L-alanine amidase [Pseudomonadota bacterium]
MAGFRADSSSVVDLCPSPNFGVRLGSAGIDTIVLHYTGVPTAARAITWLAAPQSQVSAHYLIDDDGRITQMVAERERAWHAGKSCWQGDRDINSRSVGIEIQNRGHADGYPEFPEAQIVAVIALVADIMTRQQVPARRVLAHSDVAPGRKVDPGEKFPWMRLAEAGCAVWVAPAQATETTPLTAAEEADALSTIAEIGYDIDAGSADPAWIATVVKAFQLRHRPARADGIVDRATAETAQRVREAMSSS